MMKVNDEDEAGEEIIEDYKNELTNEATMEQAGKNAWECSIQVEATNTLQPGDHAYVLDMPVQKNNRMIHELTFGIPQGPTGAPGSDGASVVFNVKRTVGLTSDEKAFVIDEKNTINNVTYHELTFGIPHGVSENAGTTVHENKVSSSVQQLEAMLPSLIEEWESNSFGTYMAGLYFLDGTSITGCTFQSYSTGILKVEVSGNTHRINIQKIGLIEVILNIPIAGSMPNVIYNQDIPILPDERAMKNGVSESSSYTFYTVARVPVTGILRSSSPGIFEVQIEDEQEFITRFDYIMYHGINGIAT